MMPQHNAPHGIGKPTANRDLTPLATANGYRPADGWGVVNQAWRPGKTGNPKTKTPTDKVGVGTAGETRCAVIISGLDQEQNHRGVIF